MASALISQLYEAINANGTYIVGADSDQFPYCLLGFEISLDWSETGADVFEIEITRPSSIQNYADWGGQVCFCEIDGGILNPIFVDYCSLYNNETGPNEYSIFISFGIERSATEDYFNGSTVACFICSFGQFFPQEQLGIVTTYPSEIASRVGLQTSLDNPYAPPATPLATPTGLYADNITSDSARIGWNAVENASGYKVEYRQAAGGGQTFPWIEAQD